MYYYVLTVLWFLTLRLPKVVLYCIVLTIVLDKLKGCHVPRKLPSTEDAELEISDWLLVAP